MGLDNDCRYCARFPGEGRACPSTGLRMIQPFMQSGACLTFVRGIGPGEGHAVPPGPSTAADVVQTHRPTPGSFANTQQVGGAHYINRKIQPWDAIIDWKLGFLDGNVVKYIARFREKGGVEDLKKARHYLDKLIEQEI